MRSSLLLVAVLSFVFFTFPELLLPVPRQAQALQTRSSTVVIKMEDCEVTGPYRLTFGEEDLKGLDPAEIQKLVIDSFKAVKLVKVGRLRTKGKPLSIYLPESSEPYSIINKGKDDSHQNNTSTTLFIDQNDDGKLVESEGWSTNLPVRVGDRMLEVISIAPDGSQIKLRSSRKPLRGVVVGRKCPPFSYKAESGKRITQRSFRGKAFLVDIWSVT